MLFAILLVANPIWADEEPEPESESEQDAEVEQVWSATVIGEFKKISDAEAHDDVGAFFDQYEFTPNKGSSVPIELGIRDFSYDRFVGPGETPPSTVSFRESDLESRCIGLGYRPSLPQSAGGAVRT